MNKVDYIDAEILGETHRLRIVPSNVDLFLTLVGEPYELLQSMLNGTWKIAKVKAVLVAGLCNGHPLSFKAKNLIDLAFNTNGPGNYVGLAVALLSAYLYRVDETDAHFTDKPKAAA